MQRAFVDASLHRRAGTPVFRGHEREWRILIRQRSAGRLHRGGLARKARRAEAAGTPFRVGQSYCKLHVSMNTSLKLAFLSSAALLAGCGSSGPGYRVYISNEASGDLTVIDPGRMEAVETVALGKRARGIHSSADGKWILVALSGSPFAPPGVDESTLPPPDHTADGIGIFDIVQNKMLRKVPGGSDPEQFAVGKDGTVYISNEDAAGVSFVDPTHGQVLHTIHTGEEPEGVTLTPDARYVYATSEHDGTVTVIDIATAQAVKTIKVGRRPRSVTFLPDGSRAFVTNENDA